MLMLLYNYLCYRFEFYFVESVKIINIYVFMLFVILKEFYILSVNSI